MTFEQFSGDYSDLSRDVINAGYETYETKLADWFDLIENSPISKARVATLQEGFDFHPWYEAAHETIGSMVGSGKLDWARDRTKRLGQQLALFKHISTNEDGWNDLTTNFLYSDNDYDANIRKLNHELFAPFVRELLKDLERNLLVDPAREEVPAADRLVSLDHNSQGYSEAVNALGQVSEAVERSNEIGADEPVVRERVVAELDAGRRLLQASQVRVQAVWAVVYPALRWVASNTAGTLIGIAVTAAIVLLAALLGVQVPGLTG